MGTLQLMDDAIAYRLSRLDLRCEACAPGGRCFEHDMDEQLIASYQDRYAEAFQDLLRGINPDDLPLIFQRGDDTPPTVGALSLVILEHLRGLAGNGPIVTELDGRPVVLEVDGPVVIEHPLAQRSGDSDAAA